MSDTENYLKTKLELLLHELQEHLDKYGKFMHKDDKASLQKIVTKHRNTLDNLGTGNLSGFVPLNLDHNDNQ